MKVQAFRNWSIAAKVMSISLATIALVTAVNFLYLLPDLEKKVLAEREATLKSVVDLPVALLAEYDQRAKQGEFSLAEATERAKARIRLLRYAGNEYFWINDLKATVIMHPVKPELEGHDQSALKDPEGKAVFVEFANTARSGGEGLVRYMWPKPGSTAAVQKISYVKLYQPWGWVIGSGLYVDDMQQAMAALRWKVGAATAAIVVLVLLIAYLVSSAISGNIKKLIAAADLLALGDVDVSIRADSTEETGRMAAALKKVAENITGAAQVAERIAAGDLPPAYPAGNDLLLHNPRPHPPSPRGR